MKPEHLDEINLVRALAISGVLMVHSTSSAIEETMQTPWLSVYNFANIFSKFGTPTFIFLSSFILFYNYYHRPFEKETILRFYRNRLLYIVAPYLIFSAIYFVVKNHNNFVTDSKLYTLTQFLKLLLTGHAHDHLYFVIINIQFYILFPLFLFLFQRIKWARISAVFLGFIIQWSFIFLNNKYLHIANKGSLCISWISYFFLGVFLGIYYGRIKDWLIIKKENFWTKRGAGWICLWMLWITSACLHITLWYRTRSTGVWMSSLYYEALYNLYGVTSALVLFQIGFLLFKHASQWLVRLMYYFGAVSFGVYLFHPLVLRFYRHFQPSLQGTFYHLWILGGFASAVGISWIVVWAASKYFKASWLFFGNVSQSKFKPRQSSTAATGGTGSMHS